MSRTRQRVVWLSIFALLAQMLLPIAHAQAWAQQSGNPLLYAFCGQVSPVLLKQLRSFAPPELLQRLQADQAKIDKLACAMCGAVHAGHLAASSHAAFALALAQQPAPQPMRVGAAPAVLLVVLPQTRGPPLVS